MRWYALARFRCPRCDQRLAVEHGQVRRGEVVTCQNCNADLRLVARGAEVPGALPGDAEAPIPVELPV